MKKIFLMVFISTAIISVTKSASCQDKAGVDSLHKNRLGKDLSIDDQKSARLMEAMQTNQYSIDTLIRSKTIKPAERQKLFIKLTQEREAKVYAILTPDEQEKFKLAVQNKFGDKRRKFQIQTDQKSHSLMLRDSSKRKNTIKH